MNDFFNLSEDWGELVKESGIVPYGMGRIGRRVLPVLLKEFHIPFLIDGGEKSGNIMGLQVLDLAKAAPIIREKHLKIVVTTVRHAYNEISKELESSGFKEYQDFCMFERFAGEWNLRWRNRCVLSKIDTVITSRCTLCCKNCNMFIGYAKQKEDISFSDLKKNFDIFFDSVDFVYEYTLLGGEPFVHKELDQILTYLMDSYESKIGKINLISNGTVVPSENILSIMARYQMSVHISDYSKTVKYGKKLAEVTKAFSEKNIEYYVIPNNTWKDVKYPLENYTAKNPREHMLLCGHSTHSVGGGKLYWCDPAFAAECFIGYSSKLDDFLDLKVNKENHSKYDASINILRYLLGDVNDRGYMSICEKCAGIGSDNDEVVIAGLQMDA